MKFPISPTGVLQRGDSYKAQLVAKALISK
jgi:hypothetical protein